MFATGGQHRVPRQSLFAPEPGGLAGLTWRRTARSSPRAIVQPKPRPESKAARDFPEGSDWCPPIRRGAGGPAIRAGAVSAVGSLNSLLSNGLASTAQMRFSAVAAPFCAVAAPRAWFRRAGHAGFRDRFDGGDGAVLLFNIGSESLVDDHAVVIARHSSRRSDMATVTIRYCPSRTNSTSIPIEPNWGASWRSLTDNSRGLLGQSADRPLDDGERVPSI